MDQFVASHTNAPHLCFNVESGTDVRLVEGLARRFQVTIFARQIHDGVEISQTPAAPVHTLCGPSSRIRFAVAVAKFLWNRSRDFDFVLVQGYGSAALSANVVSYISRTPTAMLVCSPIEVYYRLRERYPQAAKPYRRTALWALEALANTNALVGRHSIDLSQDVP